MNEEEKIEAAGGAMNTAPSRLNLRQCVLRSQRPPDNPGGCFSGGKAGLTPEESARLRQLLIQQSVHAEEFVGWRECLERNSNDQFAKLMMDTELEAFGDAITERMLIILRARMRSAPRN